MTVPASAFLRWLTTVAGDTSQAAICRGAGIKRSTLAQQLVRGRVAVATVSAISRSLDHPVLEALGAFEQFAALPHGLLPPTDAELLSQVSDVDLLAEILNRSTAAVDGEAAVPFELAPLPHRTSVRSWLDALGAGSLRQEVAAACGIAPQNLSAQISANRLSVELAITSARLAGVGLANGLVASGFLSEAEAGWPPDARSAALHRTLDSTLVTLAADRLDVLGRTLRRREADPTTVDTILGGG